MIRRQWVLIIVVTNILLALLAACGQNSSNTGGNNPSPTPTATTGPVTLRAGAASYHTNDTIEVTLTNASASTIYFQDHLTNCTIIQLQHQVNERWEIVNQCRLMIATHWHTLDAGQSVTVQLVSTPDRLWVAGLYQATLQYSTSRASGLLTTIYSAGFQVT